MTSHLLEAEGARLGTLLRLQAASRKTHLAYAFLGDDLEIEEWMSYEDVLRSAEAIATALSHHARPGDRVLLAFHNGLDAVRLFWGCVVAGVIPIPAPAPDAKNARASASRLSGIASDAGVILAVAAQDHLDAGRLQVTGVPWVSLQEMLSSHPAPTADRGLHNGPMNSDATRDIAYLQYTSGSTSQPRGVEITHANALAQCEALLLAETVNPDTARGLMWLPWFHDYGLLHGLIQPLYTGATSYWMGTQRFLLRPLRWLEAIGKHRITHSGAPNFAYTACVQALAKASSWSAQLDHWQFASCGAEPIRPSTLEAFSNAFAPHGFRQTSLAPSYGLAEAVLGVSIGNLHAPPRYLSVDAKALERNEVVETDVSSVSCRTLVACGPPLPGFDVRIVEPDLRALCRPGRVGEIWVAGPSVARGYWAQPAESEAHFGAVLLDEADSPQRYLRTGDLGFFHGGELYIAGRRKDLILVHGRNLHPQDIEHTAETAHASVRTGGVMAVSIDKASRESVVLLVECNRRPDAAVVRELIDEVQRQVAIEHQVDLYDIVPLRTGTLPRTSSGKPQRSAARRLYLQGVLEPLRLEAQAPSTPNIPSADDSSTPLEEALGHLWAEVLGQEAIDPDADFFDLGGDSLLATQLVSRLKARLGIDLPISALFEAPTLRGLAHLAAVARMAPLEPLSAQATTVTAPSTPRPPGSQVALSFSQERMWFMHAIAPENSAYNVPLALRLQGQLDMSALQRSLDRVVERHEILRTRFVQTLDGPNGEIVAAQAWPIEEVRLQATEGSCLDDLLHQHLASVCAKPFQLDRCPLFRVQVVHTGDQEAVLLTVMHHIIGDQWSFAALGWELAHHYNAAIAGVEASAPTLPIQYAEYAAWHRAWFDGERREKELAYWLHRLEGLEPLSLNADFPRPVQASFQGASLRFPLAPQDIAALKSLGAAHGASLSMVLIAALNVLLSRHTGKTDIAIGVPIANRHHLVSENLIGTFVNTLVFRTDLEGSPDFITVLSRVRDMALEAFAHQDLPFEVLVQKLGGRLDVGRQPLFNVMFNMVNTRARESSFDGLTWSRFDFDRASAQFDLTVIADTVYDGSIVLEYATALFAPETVQRMGEHLMNILRAAIDTPVHRIAELPIMSNGEMALLNAWSMGPRHPVTSGSVNEWVSRGARHAPHQTALIFGSSQLTHHELDEASNRLAHVLRQRGIARGSRVGLCLPRCNDLVVALLAVLKTGAAYVPLDPDYPAQRLAFQIADANMAIMITHAAASTHLTCNALPMLWIDADAQMIASASPAPLAPDVELDAGPEDAAYLIYTSGSTGHPKGVEVPHRAVINFLVSMAAAPGLTSQDRLLAVTTPSFDIAVLELFLPVAVGGTVVIAGEQQATDGRALSDLISLHGITAMQATPSRWHLLLDSGWPGKSDLKALVGGEPLTPSLASQLLARCGEVWNMYGPTETTVWSSCWRVEPGDTQSISLGRPISNTSIQVLDPQLSPCPIGVLGEIYIGGTGVALGYFKQAALTAERFINRPAAPIPEHTRVYRTGDQARWRHDGSLEHCGRVDDQVKLRGFRIELGEIEANLLSHPNVGRAVVILREDVPGQARLVAYVMPQGPMPTGGQLRQHLRQWLPEHMIPGHFLELDAIPLLPNGKTHRQALPIPADAGAKSVETLAPRNPIEQAIWSAWREALLFDDFGVHDNFFDLGGHSILAVRVANRIETALQRPCPLGLLFQHPTVADLAEALAPGEPTLESPMAVLQPQGESPNLFLLAGTGMYRELAQLLSSEMPVFGVFSPIEIDLLEMPAGEMPPPITIERLAAEYLALILDKQSQGPYYLGGFSIGGVLAYEVARQLRQTGRDVGLIVMLDSMLPGRGWKHVVSGIRRRVRAIRQQGLRHLLHVYRILRDEAEQRHEPGSRRNQIYAQAIRAYEATPCDMPMVFLQAGDDPSTEPAYRWRSLVPSLTVERVPGRHMEILESPNVAILATHVRAHIAAAQAAAKPAT